MKPTEIGVRFTPRMAQAISRQFIREMKGRYDLNDDQATSMEKIISVNMMKMVTKNAQTGRDMIEKMMETVIANEGRFPKEDAIEFAKLAKPIVPALRDFFTETAGEIGKQMTVKQKLKFTADAAAATAGLLVFENRMKRWEEGKIGEDAHPFFDPADNDPSLATSQPEVDTGENPEHRRARRDAERSMRWQVDIDEWWVGYVELAANFYEFDEAQNNAAQAILKDCQDRAQAVKTDAWREAVKQNLIAKQLSWRAGGSELARGPWMFKLDSDFDRLVKPLKDLELELKRRLNEIPNSAQRAKAMESVRKNFAEKGMEKLPT